MMYLAVIAAFVVVWFVLHLFYGKADTSLTASERRQTRVFEEALITGMVGCCVTMLFVLTMVEHFGEEVARGNVAAHESYKAMATMGGALTNVQASIKSLAIQQQEMLTIFREGQSAMATDEEATQKMVKIQRAEIRHYFEIANPHMRSALDLEDRVERLEQLLKAMKGKEATPARH